MPSENVLAWHELHKVHHLFQKPQFHEEKVPKILHMSYMKIAIPQAGTKIHKHEHLVASNLS